MENGRHTETFHGPLHLFDQGLIYLVFGKVARMKFFWPFLNFQNIQVNSYAEQRLMDKTHYDITKNNIFETKPTVLWFLVITENVECVEYFVEKFQNPMERDFCKALQI